MEKPNFKLGGTRAKLRSQFEMATLHKRESREHSPALLEHPSVVRRA